MTEQQMKPPYVLEQLQPVTAEIWERIHEEMEGLSRLSGYGDLLAALMAAWPGSEGFASELLDELLAVQDRMRAEGREAGRVARILAEELGNGTGVSLENELARLLSAPVLRLLSNARETLSATPQRVSGVRLTTEILPVSDREALGAVSVLVHDLRLSYDADGDVASVNLTLDPPLLRDLWLQLVYALAVEDQLRERLADPLEVFDPEGPPGRAFGHWKALEEAEAARYERNNLE